MDVAALTDSLFRCTTSGDVDGVASMCRPDLRFKQNSGDEGGVAELRALVGGIAEAGVKVTYSDIRRLVGERWLVEQHVVTLRRDDGLEASGDVCIVLRFDADGRIEQIDEYLDPASFGALLG